MRRLLAFLIGALSFIVVASVFVEASRQYITIWLPFALAALSGCVLSLLPSTPARTLTWSSISCGAVLFWLMSEPEVSFHDHPELRFVAYLLAASCAGLFLAALVRGRHDAVYRWALGVIVMSWLIAFFSSPSGGSGSMIHLAMRLFHVSEQHAETMVLVVRKTIHFTFYGTLGWTAFRWASSLSLPMRRGAAFGLLLVLVHACYDEGRQTFFPNRTASVYDVMLDVSGACVLVGSAVLTRRRRLVREVMA